MACLGPEVLEQKNQNLNFRLRFIEFELSDRFSFLKIDLIGHFADIEK